MRVLSLAVLGFGLASQVAALSWNATKYLFVFGDSYTTTGYNISAGVDSPVPGWTSSNGPNWVQFLGDTFNVADTKIFNLAYGGAVTSNKLITPYLPTVINFDQQTDQFWDYLALRPTSAPWSSENSLFAVWIGINDVGNSWYWSNVTQEEFHSTIMDTYFDQVETLYQSGARSFVFLTVPPVDRSPLMIQSGDYTTSGVKASIADYNAQLTQRAEAFVQAHPDSEAKIYDTSKVFNTLLDNAEALGYVNVTGYAEAYQNGTPSHTTQVDGYAPVSSYFWLNSLHPVFTVHYALAQALATFLSGY